MPRNPRARKTLTYDAAAARKDRGVEGLERMGNYDAADDLADESVSEFADRKHIALENSGSGSFVTFHGAFLDEAAAVKKADGTPNTGWSWTTWLLLGAAGLLGVALIAGRR